MADVDNLIAELHKREMKLVMDLVVNYTSREVGEPIQPSLVGTNSGPSTHGFLNPNHPQTTPSETGTYGRSPHSTQMELGSRPITGTKFWARLTRPGSGTRQPKSTT